MLEVVFAAGPGLEGEERRREGSWDILDHPQHTLDHPQYTLDHPQAATTGPGLPSAVTQLDTTLDNLKI